MNEETRRRDERATEELVRHLDQDVGELEALTRGLIYIAETAQPEEIDRLRPSTVTMLYVMLDRANDASRMLGALHGRMDKRPNEGLTGDRKGFMSRMLRKIAKSGLVAG